MDPIAPVGTVAALGDLAARLHVVSIDQARAGNRVALARRLTPGRGRHKADTVAICTPDCGPR